MNVLNISGLGTRLGMGTGGGKVMLGRAIANRCTMGPFMTLSVAAGVGMAFSVKAGAVQ